MSPKCPLNVHSKTVFLHRSIKRSNHQQIITNVCPRRKYSHGCCTRSTAQFQSVERCNQSRCYGEASQASRTLELLMRKCTEWSAGGAAAQTEGERSQLPGRQKGKTLKKLTPRCSQKNAHRPQSHFWYTTHREGGASTRSGQAEKRSGLFSVPQDNTSGVSGFLARHAWERPVRQHLARNPCLMPRQAWAGAESGQGRERQTRPS